MAPQGSSDPRVTSLMSLVAGGAAGGIEATCTYPFEFAKTRVQLRVDKGVPTPRNPFLVIGQVVKNEGFRSLYLGCTTLVAGTIAKDAIRFMTFDTIRRAFADKDTGKLSVLGNLGSGACAGVFASTFAVCPTERLKTALIDDARHNPVGQRRFIGAWDASKTLIREHGIQGLYRGYVTTTMKQIGTTSVRLGTYNILKDLGASYDIRPGTMTNFANGAVAGIITTYVTQPIDTIKTRAQSAKGAGTIEATKSIMQDYGIRGFWKGSTMRLGRTVFAGGILFTAYEEIIALLIPIMGRKVDDETKDAVR